MYKLERPSRGLALLLTGVVSLILVISGFSNEPAIENEAFQSEVHQDGALNNLVGIALPVRDQNNGPLFEKVLPPKTGIDFTHKFELWEEVGDPETALYWSSIAIGDYDSDGLPDLFLTRPQGGCKLYRNVGDFQFEDATSKAGISSGGNWPVSATFSDLNGDNHIDLYVCYNESPNLFYQNQGNGTFKEVAGEMGLGLSRASSSVAFSDYDRDGDLDAYLLTHGRDERLNLKTTLQSVGGIVQVPEEYKELVDFLIKPDGTPMQIDVGEGDHLLRNDGNGQYTDVTQTVGISGYEFGLSVNWWDYNHDGFPDIYVANDFWGADHLYRNNKDGTFTDATEQVLPHTPWFSMGADSADINNDGLEDFIASDMSSTTHYGQKVGMGNMSDAGWFLDSAIPRQYMRNALYLNTGTERMMEVAFLAGLDSTDWTWTLRLADFDEDGRIDLFVTNGMTRDWTDADLDAKSDALGGKNSPEGRKFWLSQPQRKEKNQAYRNNGDLKFEEVGQEWGLDHLGVSYGAATGDLDGDGDLDLVVTDFEAPVVVYRNQSAGANRIVVDLDGSHGNTDGIGAKVRIETESGQQMRSIKTTRGFAGSSEPIAHFGLGSETQINRLTVEWPSGHVQVFENLPANHRYTITEPEEAPPGFKQPTLEPTLYASSNVLGVFYSDEIPYNDFERQPLLPQKMSQLGPGAAWGDVNKDGYDDLFISGPSGEAGTLFLNTKSGKLRKQYLSIFKQDIEAEDMGALFFDANADGNLDLYVVSGGVECEPGDAILRDRLYWGDGKGGFVRAPENTLPDLRDSGSCVAACDFDRDGDLDLFVGGRVIPGAYPATPQSRLLRNEGGRFISVEDELAPGLGQIGLVTSSLWSDVDQDGWTDLLITSEWGPVHLYRNREGKLAKTANGAGLAERLGWWNGITGGDLDLDGDIDYVVTNFGLNTKYHASFEHPTLLYYGDVDGTGRQCLIEAEYENDILYPVRGKSCSTAAIPMLGDLFSTYKDFALADLTQIYTPEKLDQSTRYEANTLESGVLINDGSGRFAWKPLPHLAQASPSFGVAIVHADDDSYPDLYLAQNFYSPQPETGRMDGGISLLLAGLGDGSFRPVPPTESGLVVPGDAKALAVADVNNDGWDDFIVTVNDDKPETFVRTSQNRGTLISVRLEGDTGNPTGIGSQIVLELSDGTKRVAEVYAGDSYLSQSSPTQRFQLPEGVAIAEVHVRWPNGKRTSVTPSMDDSTITIKAPSLAH